VSLAVLLVGDRVPGAPPFLAVRPAAPPGLQIRIAGVAQLERAPPHCANTQQQRQSRSGKEKNRHGFYHIDVHDGTEASPKGTLGRFAFSFSSLFLAYLHVLVPK